MISVNDLKKVGVTGLSPYHDDFGNAWAEGSMYGGEVTLLVSLYHESDPETLQVNVYTKDGKYLCGVMDDENVDDLMWLIQRTVKKMVRKSTTHPLLSLLHLIEGTTHAKTATV